MFQVRTEHVTAKSPWVEDEEDVEDSINVADAHGEAEGDVHGFSGDEHEVIWQGTKYGSHDDGKTVDDDCEVSGDIDDGVYIRSDHPPTRALWFKDCT